MSNDEKRLKSLGMSVDAVEEIPALNRACCAVMRVLSDGQWHTAHDLIMKTGYTEAPRRLREIRSKGVRIEKRGSGRKYDYRLVQ